MAGAEAAVQRVVVEKPAIPARLVTGSKFLKWPKSDGDDSSFVPITLRVDPQGYILYWQEPNKQEKLDRAIQNFADPQKYKMLNDSDIPVSEKCFTVVYGVRLVELTFLNFVAVEAHPQNVVKEWSDAILKIAYHPCSRHISLETAFEKAFCKLKHETNSMGMIPVQRVFKMIGAKQKKVEDAMLSVGLIGSKRDATINPDEFHFAQFKKLLQLCCPRPEVDNVFSELGTGARRLYINHHKVKDFINTKQRDPKLNAILFPPMTDDQAVELVQKHEPNLMFANKVVITDRQPA